MRYSQWLLAPVSGRARRRLYAAAVAVFTLIAIPLLWSSSGVAATDWMHIYHMSDFTTWGKLVDFVANLRVPIPLPISLAEILEYRLAGRLFLTNRVGYVAAIYLAFVLALWLASAGRLRLAAALVLAVVYVWGLRIVHAGNPQTYDVIFACLVMVYVVALERAVGATTAGGEPAARRASAWVFAAGLALTLAELSRAYFIYLLPVLLAAACLALRGGGWRRVALFLLPVVMLSGVWHFHIARTQGQIAWSNHSGFNLQRSWSMVELPVMVEETGSAPLAPGRWLNLDTPEHTANSRLLTSAVVAYVRAHPAASLQHALFRLQQFLSIQTGVYDYQPDHPGLIYYRVAGWLGLAWLAAQGVVAAAALFRRRWAAFLTPQSQLIAIAAASILVLSLAEAYEEARLFVTLLPFLAALPVFGHAPQEARHS